MRAVIVYESMFGNTRAVAEAIARGVEAANGATDGTTDGAAEEATGAATVTLLPAAEVAQSPQDLIDGADLLVVGGPTHAHSMSRPSTRQAAHDQAAKNPAVTLEAGATNPGLREWFDEIGGITTNAAAFDTRLDAPAMFTGHASHRIEKMLHRHGAFRIAEAESFVVDKQNHLVDGELARAEQWGRTLAEHARYQRTHAVQ